MEFTITDRDEHGAEWHVWIHMKPLPGTTEPHEVSESFIIGSGATRPLAIMDALAALEVAENELRTLLRAPAGASS